MAVSKTHKGWRWDRVNDRLDFYYDGTRIGHIDSGGIDLAAGLDYEIDTASATGGVSSLDTAYDGGRSITLDEGTITLASNQSSADTLTITEADNSNTKSLIDLTHARTASKDIDGTGSAWSVTGAGLGTFTHVALTSGTAPAATVVGIYNDNTGDLNLNAYTGKSIELDVADTNIITCTGTAITLAKSVTLSASASLTITDTGLTITAGGATIGGAVGITGTTTITGDATISGTLSVGGNMTWASALTVDELLLDTDGDASTHAAVSYVLSDNTGDTTINSKTGKEVHLSIANNDEFSVSGTVVNIHGNILALDADANTKLDCATGDTIKIYVAGSQDFTITANTFDVLGGSALVLADDCHLAIGTTLDAVLILDPDGVSANAALGGVLIGTPVNYATNTNSLIISNVTDGGDIQIAVNKGGHSQTVLFADSSAGNLYINAAASGSILVAVANVTEYTFDATLLTIASGNDIKFAGNDGILDSDGDELIQFTAATDAVNYLQIINAATANPITLQCLGTDDKGFMFEAVNDEEILELVAGTGATTYMQITSANNAAVTLGATGETNTALKLDTSGTGNIIFALGGTETLAFHDASITLAAASATVGHALYMQTEDGGVASSGAGQAGGAWEIRTGDGTATDTGGQVGGAGGALTLVSGLGHDGSAAGQGGAGGAIAITAGEGGDAGSGAAGAGGTITLTAGAGGGGGTGTTGIPGSVVIGAGVLKLKKQTIDMANGNKALTLDPTDPVLGVLLTGNILYVDPNGVGSPELKLPDEDDCDGLFLQIVNTAGAAEVITIVDDASGGIVTCTQNETAYCVCDGTTWRGTTGVA